MCKWKWNECARVKLEKKKIGLKLYLGLQSSIKQWGQCAEGKWQKYSQQLKFCNLFNTHYFFFNLKCGISFLA